MITTSLASVSLPSPPLSPVSPIWPGAHMYTSFPITESISEEEREQPFIDPAHLERLRGTMVSPASPPPSAQTPTMTVPRQPVQNPPASRRASIASVLSVKSPTWPWNRTVQTGSDSTSSARKGGSGGSPNTRKRSESASTASPTAPYGESAYANSMQSLSRDASIRSAPRRPSIQTRLPSSSSRSRSNSQNTASSIPSAPPTGLVSAFTSPIGGLETSAYGGFGVMSPEGGKLDDSPTVPFDRIATAPLTGDPLHLMKSGAPSAGLTRKISSSRRIVPPPSPPRAGSRQTDEDSDDEDDEDEEPEIRKGLSLSKFDAARLATEKLSQLAVSDTHQVSRKISASALGSSSSPIPISATTSRPTTAGREFPQTVGFSSGKKRTQPPPALDLQPGRPSSSRQTQPPPRDMTRSVPPQRSVAIDGGSRSISKGAMRPTTAVGKGSSSSITSSEAARVASLSHPTRKSEEETPSRSSSSNSVASATTLQPPASNAASKATAGKTTSSSRKETSKATSLSVPSSQPSSTTPSSAGSASSSAGPRSASTPTPPASTSSLRRHPPSLEPPILDQKSAPKVDPAPASGMYWYRALSHGLERLPLRAHTCTLVGNSIFVFGGCDARACFNDLWVFDADSMFWSKPTCQGTLPPPLRAMTTTAVGKKLVIFGGGDGPTYYNDVYVLDTVTFKYTKPPLNEKSPQPSKRRAHTACLYKNGIYVFGGGDGVRALNDVWRLDVSDLSKLTWKQICKATAAPPTSTSTKARAVPSPPDLNRPTARGYHTANMVASKLIIFGGSDGLECFRDVWVFDVATLVWSSVNIKTSYPRLSHTATIVGSYLFVVGGHDGQEYSSEVLLLNLVTMQWDKRRVYGLPPSGRGYHGAVLHDSRLFVMGGFDGHSVFADTYILELAVSSYYSQISHFTIEV